MSEARQARQARQALQAYAERRRVNRDTGIIAELAELVDKALAAGLSIDEVRGILFEVKPRSSV